MATREQPQGDPAFEGSGAITHKPIDESKRFDSEDLPDVVKRPIPLAAIGVALAFAVAGIIAGAVAGWAYTIPIEIVAVIVAVFSLTSWALGRRALS